MTENVHAAVRYAMYQRELEGLERDLRKLNGAVSSCREQINKAITDLKKSVGPNQRSRFFDVGHEQIVAVFHAPSAGIDGEAAVMVQLQKREEVGNAEC